MNQKPERIRLLCAALILCLAWVWTSPATAASVTPYPRVPGDEASPHFTVTVDGTPVEVCHTAMKVGYAHFAFEGSVKVEITATEAIKSFDLSPHRAGIAAQAEGRTLVFELSKVGWLHLQINGLPRLFLFAEAPEGPPPASGEGGTFDLTRLGVISSEEAVQTEAIQKAIDTVAAKRGVLHVPPGIYRTGELRMKSHLTLHLAAGAILKGTGQPGDHPVGEFGTQLIHFLDCEQVRICGRGVIDAQGRALRLAGENNSASRSKLIRSYRARDIVVEDVILRDSGTWGVHLIESEDLRFSGVKLISNTKHDDPEFPWEMNTDGFDPDNSSRVRIERCFISGNDDSIAVKLRYGARRDISDITFRDNVCWTVKSALKIGTEIYEKKLSRVLFENNDVIHADRGIVAYVYDGGSVEDVVWRGNHHEFIGGDIKAMHMEIKIVDRNGKGQLGRLRIENETFEQEAENPSLFQGVDAGHAVRDVSIVNLQIAGKRCLDAKAARIHISRHADPIDFE